MIIRAKIEEKMCIRILIISKCAYSLIIKTSVSFKKMWEGRVFRVSSRAESVIFSYFL